MSTKPSSDEIILQSVKDDVGERLPAIDVPSQCRVEGGIKLTLNKKCVATLVGSLFKKNTRINLTATLRSCRHRKDPTCRIYTIPGNNQYHVEYSCSSGHRIYLDTRMGQYVNLFVESGEDDATDVLPFTMTVTVGVGVDAVYTSNPCLGNASDSPAIHV